jgi:hypothetical protein
MKTTDNHRHHRRHPLPQKHRQIQTRPTKLTLSLRSSQAFWQTSSPNINLQPLHDPKRPNILALRILHFRYQIHELRSVKDLRSQTRLLLHRHGAAIPEILIQTRTKTPKMNLLLLMANQPGKMKIWTHLAHQGAILKSTIPSYGVACTSL